MSIASFVPVALAILLTPGPTNTILAASAAATGFRRAALLPLAEAAGYAVAIGFFLAAAERLGDVPTGVPTLRALAAVWLLIAAVRLWRQPVVPTLAGHRGAVFRVFVTTLLNPKAMLVGTTIIPGLMPDAPAAALVLFVVLSSLAGAGWVAFGVVLPARLRRHSYKGAAVIVAGFGLAAAVSALQT